MRKILILVALLLTVVLSAQTDSSKFKFEGYIFGLYLKPVLKNLPNADNFQIYNRLNLFYSPSQTSIFTVQMRNTALLGTWIKPFPSAMGKLLNSDLGFVDMSNNLFEDKNLIFNINIDRLYYQFSKNKIEVTFGRQRVNWGKTLVWNPNDIFNASSFLAFDYVEKPGSDAARLVYYLNPTNSLDFAVKIDSGNRLTYAGKYGFNFKKYDIQLITGVFKDDLVAGLGWAGNIKQLGFKGEATLFVPVFDTLNAVQLSATAAFDFSFNNGLFLIGQVLFSPLSSSSSIYNQLLSFSGSLDARNLSFADWSLLGQASYSFSPVFSSSLALMYFPDKVSFLIYPSLNYSLTNNLDISMVAQYFSAQKSSINNGALSITYLYFGLKYYF